MSTLAQVEVVTAQKALPIVTKPLEGAEAAVEQITAKAHVTAPAKTEEPAKEATTSAAGERFGYANLAKCQYLTI